jgi:hypothetical protein
MLGARRSDRVETGTGGRVGRAQSVPAEPAGQTPGRVVTDAADPRSPNATLV